MSIKRTAQLLHNPGAGSAAGKDELINLIRSQGFECIYTSTQNKKWQIDPAADFVVVAGGDGTVRKAGLRMLQDGASRKPIALLPMGTANNISKSLKIEGDAADIAATWKQWRIKCFDTADIKGFGRPMHLLESIGFGLFPYLMKQMAGLKDVSEDPEEKLEQAQKVMRKIVKGYKGRRCRLKIDGIKYSGEFLMVEVMNTASVSANLHLNAAADVSDNRLEVVLLQNKQRHKFAQYLKAKMEGKDGPFDIVSIKAKEVQLRWKGKLCHVDDELLEMNKNKRIGVHVRQHTLEFLV